MGAVLSFGLTKDLDLNVEEQKQLCIDFVQKGYTNELRELIDNKIFHVKKSKGFLISEFLDDKKAKQYIERWTNKQIVSAPYDYFLDLNWDGDVYVQANRYQIKKIELLHSKLDTLSIRTGGDVALSAIWELKKNPSEKLDTLLEAYGEEKVNELLYFSKSVAGFFSTQRSAKFVIRIK